MAAVWYKGSSPMADSKTEACCCRCPAQPRFTPGSAQPRRRGAPKPLLRSLWRLSAVRRAQEGWRDWSCEQCALNLGAKPAGGSAVGRGAHPTGLKALGQLPSSGCPRGSDTSRDRFREVLSPDAQVWVRESACRGLAHAPSPHRRGRRLLRPRRLWPGSVRRHGGGRRAGAGVHGAANCRVLPQLGFTAFDNLDLSQSQQWQNNNANKNEVSSVLLSAASLDVTVPDGGDMRLHPQPAVLRERSRRWAGARREKGDSFPAGQSHVDLTTYPVVELRPLCEGQAP